MKFRNGREILEITSIKFNHKKREKKKKRFQSNTLEKKLRSALMYINNKENIFGFKNYFIFLEQSTKFYFKKCVV